MVGGRYRLKTVQPGRSIQPPSEISLSSISIGLPGAQVICSTAALASSHLAGEIGLPSGPMTGGRRALTLPAGHSSRDGAKM